MKYKITHNTTYEYTETVPVCQNIMHLAPRNSTRQTCMYHRLIVKPEPSHTSRRTDYFGNQTSYVSIHQGHRRLAVTAISKVDVLDRTPPVAAETTAWETVRDWLPGKQTPAELEAYQFAFPSPHVTVTDEFAGYAAASFAAGRPVLEAAMDLTARIHTEFAYDPLATTVSTPVDEVFKNRRGVCQDLAHFEIACLRSLGLPARYVSGYLRTIPPPGRPRLVGADASHAWVAVHCGNDGWVDLDPTNNLVVNTEHITVAWGRDYSDVCPINGMYVGGGQHTLGVSVDVAEIS